MRVLHFDAVVGHPQVTPAVMAQANDALRPFSRFVRQTIHTAKQRQSRYQLPWERVRNLAPIRLTPRDTVVHVRPAPPDTILKGWPAGKDVDLRHLGFVVNRGVPFKLQSARPTPDGLAVRTDPELEPGDDFVLCGVTGRVERPETRESPSRIEDLSGRTLPILTTPRPDGTGGWTLVVRGKVDASSLRVDGQADAARVLPDTEGLHSVRDSRGREYPVSAGQLRVEDMPADGDLVGDNGVRFEWQRGGATGRSGAWVQLLPPGDSDPTDADETLDPRAAFCEGDVEAVWTQPNFDVAAKFEVRRVDGDRYQLLLDQYPPDGTRLHLPVDNRNLYLQRRALRQLAEAPLPHHRGLLRLCEDPDRVRWPPVEPPQTADLRWRFLTDPTRSGTDEQREFVQKALGTPDFAFLEGPPGSGKTTAICEIAHQFIERGQRVLLCASTHVAIDNVLERLLDAGSSVDAVRVGRLERVDDRVQSTQLDARAKELVDRWKSQPSMKRLGDAELARMAERTVIMAANLTCGTTMGIAGHPLFRGRDADLQAWERPISTMPHWDVLIVDEASKTLVPEFLVPALMARRWIIVGDVRQLPPFADRSGIVANLRELVDDRELPVFTPDLQRACLLRHSLLRASVRRTGVRWLVVERPSVLDALCRELVAQPPPDLGVVRVASAPSEPLAPVVTLTPTDLKSRPTSALHLAAANWVLVPDDLLRSVAPALPSDLASTRELVRRGDTGLERSHPSFLRHAWWLNVRGRLSNPFRDRGSRIDTLEQLEAHLREFLERHDLAQELAWRLTRLHELRRSRSDRERVRLRDDVRELQPRSVDITESIDEIQDIGLPSVIEVLQDGIGTDRTHRKSGLTVGLGVGRSPAFQARFASLSYQHRMHPEIAQFPRDTFYQGQALLDANTISIRDQHAPWDFGSFRSRFAWADVRGRESQNENADEVRAMKGLALELVEWARRRGPPSDRPFWEVACLAFYVRQERSISEMLRQLTGDSRRTRFKSQEAPLEFVCATVDRFQGREADLVMLSMRNTRRVGFLDSPNRLNVALTRARQQLVVFGDAEYFARCSIDELEGLARQTSRVAPNFVARWERCT